MQGRARKGSRQYEEEEEEDYEEPEDSPPRRPGRASRSGQAPATRQQPRAPPPQHGYDERSQGSSRRSGTNGRGQGRGKGGGSVWDEYGFPLKLTPQQQLDRQACLRSAAACALDWADVQAESGLDLPRKSKLKKMIRRGIPPSCRAAVWMAVSGAEELRGSRPSDHFERMYKAGARSTAVRQITLDLPRTFPEHPWVQSGEGQLLLRHVLVALAMHIPQVGYCQGLNSVAALLLLFTDKDQETSFWLLATLVERILYPQTYSPHLAGCHVEMRTLFSLIGRKLPHLHQHLMKLECDVAVFSTDWFLCLFAISLPSESTARVWDALFHEGPKILFRVSLALLQLLEPYLLECDNAGDLLMTVKAAAAALHDHDRLMKTAFDGLGSFPLKKIEEYRAQHQLDVERMVRLREANAREQEARRELKARREAAERERDREAERIMDEEIEDGWMPQLDNVFNMAKRIVQGGTRASSEQSSRQGSGRPGARGRRNQAEEDDEEEEDDEDEGVSERDIQEREEARRRMEMREKLDAMRRRREARLAAGTWTEEDEEAFDMSLQDFAQSAAQAIKGGAAQITKGFGIVANKAVEAARRVGDVAMAAAAQLPSALDRPQGSSSAAGGRSKAAGTTGRVYKNHSYERERGDVDEEEEEEGEEEEVEEEEPPRRGRPAAPPGRVSEQGGGKGSRSRPPPSRATNRTRGYS